MNPVFTAYVRSLAEGEPDLEGYTVLRGALRGALVHKMRARGLWDTLPYYLGVYGGNSWKEEELLDELVGDCYTFIFIRRLPGLLKQLIVKENIDGLVFLNIEHFLHDAQKKHDPYGYRVFEVLESAIQQALDARRLYVLENGPKIRNDTVFGFTPWDQARLSPSPDLSRLVKVWNDDLMPDLITARGKARRKVEARLQDYVARLPDEGIEGFRFKDLIDPMKHDVKIRCGALLSPGVTATQEGEDVLVNLVPADLPGDKLEALRQFQALSSCIQESIDKLSESKRKRDLLHKLLALFRDRVLSGEDEPLANLGIARLLGLPKDSPRRLKTKLADLATDCQEVISGKPPVRGFGEGSSLPASTTRAHQEGSDPMQLTSRAERQRIQTEEAAGRVARVLAEAQSRPDRPPHPGDSFLFRETSSYAVEWLVIEADPEAVLFPPPSPEGVTKKRLLVVPVDDNPMVGSRDVETADALNTPLSIRCDFGVWLDVQAFDPQLRTGSLGPEVVAEVLRKRAEIEAETLEGSLLEQEVDDNPLYKAWIDESLHKAQAALVGPASGLERRSIHEIHKTDRTTATRVRHRPTGDFLRIYGLAASVLLVVGLWVLVRQKSHLDELGAEHDQVVTRLDVELRERERIEEEHRTEVVQLAEDHLQQITRLEQEIADLRQESGSSQRLAPMSGLPVERLYPLETSRSGIDFKRLRVPASAELIVLVLSLDNPAPVAELRLLILELDSEREILRLDGLRTIGPQDISLALPTASLPPGEYRLDLVAVDSAATVTVAEYGLLVE